MTAAILERTETRSASLKLSDGHTVRATVPTLSPTQVPTGIAAGRSVIERNTSPAATPIRRYRLG
jgi:hypothetical protein